MQQMFQEWGQSLQKYNDEVQEFIDKSKQFRESVEKEIEERRKAVETLGGLGDISAYTEFTQQVATKQTELANQYKTQLAAIDREINNIMREQENIAAFYESINDLAKEMGINLKENETYTEIITELNRRLLQLGYERDRLEKLSNTNQEQYLNLLREEYYLKIKIREEEERRKRIEQLFQRLEPHIMRYGGIGAYMQYQRALLSYQESLWQQTAQSMLENTKLEFNDLLNFLVTQVGIASDTVEREISKGFSEKGKLLPEQKNFVSEQVQNLIETYVNELQKRQNKDILAKGLFDLLGGSLEMFGISGSKNLFGTFFSVMQIRKGLEEELFKLPEDAVKEQDAIIDLITNAEATKWRILAEIAKAGVAQYMEIIKGFHNLEIQYAAERVKLQEQLKYGLIEQNIFLSFLLCKELKQLLWLLKWL